jgi:type VI secretion system ImpH/TssG family protein
MAAKNGPTSQHLSFLHKAAQTAQLYGLFPLLRGAEARAPGLPRIGTSRLPAQNIVDLNQVASLAFAPSTLESIEIKGERAAVNGYWLGLTGPMGPLPLHLSEFALNERRYGPKRPFGRFLDLLAGRMLQFFYRAWADSQPVAHADRPLDDRFAGYVAALSGAGEGTPANAAFPAEARLHYASLFASHRSAAGIQDALSHLLGTPVRLIEFQPRWRAIEPEDRTRLGGAGGFNALGRDTVIGSSVRGVTDAFRIVVRTRSFREYESFLPTGPQFKIAAEALDAFSPSHLEWELELELDEREARPARLDGRTRMGWTSWMAPTGRTGVRAEARLGRSAKRIA